MGHYEEVLEGKGKTQQEALNSALEQFWYDNGHDYSISRHLKAELVAYELPKQWVTTEIPGQISRLTGRRGLPTLVSEWEPAWGTPTRDWLQVWEFTIDFHR